MDNENVLNEGDTSAIWNLDEVPGGMDDDVPGEPDEGQKEESSRQTESDADDKPIDEFEDTGDDADKSEDAEKDVEAAEAEKTDDDDNRKVTLRDGEELTLRELEDGFLRQRDYTQKTTDLAREREETQKLYEATNQAAEAILAHHKRLVDGLVALLPPEPDVSLITKDPTTYQQRMALRQRAEKEVAGLLQMVPPEEVTQQTDTVASTRLANHREAEERKLLAAIPSLRSPTKREAFRKEIAETAKEFGFSDKEVEDTLDHRVLNLVRYARIGKRAEKNRASVRKTAGANRRDTSRRLRNSVKGSNAGSMSVLARSGRIEDAMKLNIADID